jgi:hypothetical protein
MTDWKRIGEFAGYFICAKGNERRLYDPVLNRIVLRYKRVN